MFSCKYGTIYLGFTSLFILGGALILIGCLALLFIVSLALVLICGVTLVFISGVTFLVIRRLALLVLFAVIGSWMLHPLIAALGSIVLGISIWCTANLGNSQEEKSKLRIRIKCTNINSCSLKFYVV